MQIYLTQEEEYSSRNIYGKYLRLNVLSKCSKYIAKEILHVALNNDFE